MGCDDGHTYIDLIEGNPRTILTWSLTDALKPSLDEHADTEARGTNGTIGMAYSTDMIIWSRVRKQR
jgi:hypothetical protein